jgi:acetyl-CoA carboxylase biotin carboxyl carrier protein
MKGPKSKKSAPGQGFTIPGVDLVQVERVLDFMASHGLEEFEYAHGGLHIRLKSAATARSPQPGGQAPAEIGADATPVEASAEPAGAPESGMIAPAPRAAPPKEELHLIKSPIVGTFYAASSPEALPFVKVGDTIQAGQVVCIIEAMKLMNEIEADLGGEIVGVLAENGQPVEYGQTLFALRPARKKKK